MLFLPCHDILTEFSSELIDRQSTHVPLSYRTHFLQLRNYVDVECDSLGPSTALTLTLSVDVESHAHDLSTCVEEALVPQIGFSCV